MKKLKIYFLNVGQGDSTYFQLQADSRFYHMLVDCNYHPGQGIDVARFLADEITRNSGTSYIDYVVVTHPHEDHVKGIARFSEFEIGELWDSGHTPADSESSWYRDYQKFKEAHRSVLRELKMSRTPVPIFDGHMSAHIFSPSRFITPDDEMTAEERREAIHEQCMVIKLTLGHFAVLITGDSNKSAWERISAYDDYRQNLVLHSSLLSASHHGSRTFFKKDEDDEPLLDGIKLISPSEVVVSVGGPSKHDHPHKDALELYRKHSSGEILQTPDGTVICEVSEDGMYSIWNDAGPIQDEYGLPENGDGGDGGKGKPGGPGGAGRAASISVITPSKRRIDERPAA